MMIAIIVVAALVVVGVVVFFLMRSSGGKSTSAGSSASRSGPSTSPALRTNQTKDGLKIEVLKNGEGAREAKWGNQVSVHYTGWLTDGTQFDSSHNRGKPFSFKLGTGKVISGWEDGLKGMKSGEKRRLTIPHQLGYGISGQGRIPPKATLIFEVEMIEFG